MVAGAKSQPQAKRLPIGRLDGSFATLGIGHVPEVATRYRRRSDRGDGHGDGHGEGLCELESFVRLGVVWRIGSGVIKTDRWDWRLVTSPSPDKKNVPSGLGSASAVSE
jgi:hypothetical protein